jgi:hypothetical protein
MPGGALGLRRWASWFGLTAALFVSTAAAALPTGGGGPGGGGGGGGGNVPPPPYIQLSQLEADGFNCRPYQSGHRCEGTTTFAITDTTTIYIYLCDAEDNCQGRAAKPFPATVPTQRFDIWAFQFLVGFPKAIGFGDVDGDGKADVVGVSGIFPVSGDVQVGLSNGVEFSEVPQTWASGFCAGAEMVCTLGDFDGDKRSDVVAFDPSSGNVTVAVSNGTAFVDSRIWSSTLASQGASFLVGDFDGDGFADAAAITAAGNVLVALNRPGPPLIEAAVQPIGPPIGIAGPRIFVAATDWNGPLCSPPFRCLVGDFNGDRRADIVAIGPTGEADVALSTGSSFAAAQSWAGQIGPNPSRFLVADVTGDGRDDLVVIQADGSLTIAVSSGTSFVSTVSVQDMYCAVPGACQVADLNGDGFPDLLEVSQGTLQGADGTNELGGDVWVSLGGSLRGFPIPPPRPTPPDSDGDGIPDSADNCIYVYNPDQKDSVGDGIGDACRLSADLNGDGVVNFEDLVILKQHFFTNYPPADLNHDGVVNFADLAIMKSQFFKTSGPSAAQGPPQIELQSPVHGVFYDPGSTYAWVSGFLRNVAAVDSQLVVHSQTLLPNPVLTQPAQVQVVFPIFQHVPVDTTLSVASDGYFEGFVPIDSSAPLNPIVVDATRLSTQGKFGTTSARVVAIVGSSVTSGILSPLSFGARIETWALDHIGQYIGQNLNVDQIGTAAAGGDVLYVDIGSQPTIDARTFSGLLQIDVMLPRMDVGVNESVVGSASCSVYFSIQNAHAVLQYTLQAALDPSQVVVSSVAGFPTLNFGSINVSTNNPVCGALAYIDDAKGKAHDRILSAIGNPSSSDPGPVGGAIQAAINGIDLSGVLSNVNVTLSTRFHAFTEDVIGAAFDLDTGFAPTGAASFDPQARIYQALTSNPPFPLLSPSGATYDLAISLSPDTLNQLLAALTANGVVAQLLVGQSIDLSAYAGALGAFGLQAKVNLIPTLAPILTGQPGAAPGTTQAQVGQLLLEIPTLDGRDVFRKALDLQADLGIALISPTTSPTPGAPACPSPQSTGTPAPACIQATLQNLRALASKTVHVPSSFPTAALGFFEATFDNALTSELATKSVGVTYPVPSFQGFQLEAIGLTLQSNGGALAFGDLQLGP